MTRLRVLASPEDALLCGPDGDLPAARVVAPDAEADVTVALGEHPGADGEGGARVWWREPDAAAETDDGVRVIGAGAQAWRWAPWPAHDALFGLPLPPGGDVLVVGEPERAAGVVRELHGRGAAASSAPLLTRAGLRDASTVLLLGTPGAPLPARAPAVLAAGRVLVAPRAEPVFGLLAGIDHLAYADDAEAVQLADAAAAHPEAFTFLRATARIAAAPHRASRAYARLLVDVNAEGPASAQRSARTSAR